MQERLELFGVSAPEANQPGKHAQRLWSEMVLDHFDLLLDCLRTQAEKLEQLGQRAMPHLDVLGHSATPGGQREAAVPFIVHEPAPRQPAHHVGNRRWAEAKRGSNIRHAGITFLLHQLLDTFQVIFRGLRAICSRPIRVTGFGAHRGLPTKARGEWPAFLCRSL